MMTASNCSGFERKNKYKMKRRVNVRQGNFSTYRVVLVLKFILDIRFFKGEFLSIEEVNSKCLMRNMNVKLNREFFTHQSIEINFIFPNL